MKRLKSVLMLAMGMLILASCNRDEALTEVVDAHEAQFTGSITALRATGTVWESGDEIGIFALRSGEATSAGIYNESKNVRHTLSGSNAFVPAGKKITMPQDGSLLDFVAYYPYTAAVEGDTYAVDLSDQSKLSRIDFMLSRNARKHGKDNKVVPLQFEHKLSCLNISLDLGERTANSVAVSVEGFKTKAIANLFTGEVTPQEGSATLTPKVERDGGNAYSFAMILVPGDDLANATFKVNVDGSLYEWRPTAQVLTGGKRYRYTLHLKGSTISTAIANFGAVIEEWGSTPSNPDEITLKPTGTVVIPDPTNAEYTETPVYTTNGGRAPHAAKILHFMNKRYLLRSTELGPRNYMVMFDTLHRVPYWVAYPLHKDYLTKVVKRTDEWAYDPAIKPEYQPNLKRSYNNTHEEWSRGHLLASGDRTHERAANEATFYYTNMAPQAGGFNSGQWNQLEQSLQGWTTGHGDTVFVVTGVIFPQGSQSYTTDASNVQIPIPTYFYKVIMKRVKGVAKCIAFKMQNNTVSQEKYQECAVSVTALEHETGFTFFSGIDAAAKQNASLETWLSNK